MAARNQARRLPHHRPQDRSTAATVLAELLQLDIAGGNAVEERRPLGMRCAGR
jgi:hypothetical protein